MRILCSMFILICSVGLQAKEGSPPAELDVVDTYAEAKRLEKEIIEMYREIRAAELSVVQRQTYDRSLESTLIPLSDRAEVNAELLRMAAADAAALEAYQKELGVVVQETDAIVSNARSLLEQFIDEPTASRSSKPEEERPETEEEERPETAEEQAAREAREKTEKAEREKREKVSREEKAKREKARKEKQEKLEKEVEEELAQTEKHLEEALKEVLEAREEVKKEQEEVEKAITQKEEKQEKAEEEKNRKAKLEDLKKQVDEAEEAVEKVVEQVKELKEPSKEQKEKAEKALKELREAMAKVMKADKSASESGNKEAKEHTAKAVERMKSAGESLGSASDKLSELESLAEGDGDGGSNSDGDGEGEGLSEALAIERQQALGKLAKASSGKWVDLTEQMRGLKLTSAPNIPPEAELPELWASREELDTMPSARKVLSSSLHSNTWFFVGDWYVLNRYDNEGRANIQKVYPPESILDLNAHYLSEDGKRLQWEYESYAPPVMTPYGWEEWKIYYFYTELYFEEETEAWLAIGSDDRSDLWINDLPVWHSSNQHKGWYPGEGFRKVVFREGHNKVLLRLENGHGGAGVSVFLNVE